MTYRAPCAFSGRGINQRFEAGFSFVEVIIVTLLLGIVAAAGLPALSSSLDDTRRSAAAGEVVTALEFAQLTAASTGRQTRVTIDAAADTILVEQLKYSSDILAGGAILAEATVENASFAAMQYPLKRGTDYNISLANEKRFGGVDITAVDFNSDDFVTYDALGTPSSSGTVNLSLGGGQIQVTVDGLTGKVVVIY